MDGTVSNSIALSTKFVTKKSNGKPWDEYNKAMALFGLPQKKEEGRK